MSAFDVDKHFTMPCSRTTMIAVYRTTMICRWMVYASTQTPTRPLLQEYRFVHLAVTKVPSEPYHTLGLSQLL
jgi:hypothetical protein